MNRITSALLIVLLCGGETSVLAESNLELRWTELASLIQGHQVQLALPQGKKLKGEAVVVREDSLVVNGNKGSVAIPRDSVTLIRLERTRGDAGRKLGTIIGVITGLAVGGYVTARTSSAGVGIPLFLGVASAITIGGYHSGRALDRRDVTIKVLPRDSETSK